MAIILYLIVLAVFILLLALALKAMKKEEDPPRKPKCLDYECNWDATKSCAKGFCLPHCVCCCKCKPKE